MAQAFQKITGESRLDKYGVSSVTASIGDCLMWSRTTGNLVAATSALAQTDTAYIVASAVASGDTLALVHRVQQSEEFIMSTTNNSNSAHNGQRMVLTSSTAVNNTGTDNSSGVVLQLAPVGAAGNKQIRAIFLTLGA